MRISLKSSAAGILRAIIPAISIVLIGTAPAVASGYHIVDLTPPPALESSGAAANGGVQGGDITVGFYRLRCGGRKICRAHQTHASTWAGTASTFVDLDPPGYFTSTVAGLSGRLQVGFGLASEPVAPGYLGYDHALLWSGTTGSMIDLHPAQYRASNAYGTDGTVEVGSGISLNTGTQRHALLWFGSAASVIDLNGTILDDSEAYAVANGREVGGGGLKTFTGEHAYLWTGSAASGVDLNPPGYSTSTMFGLDASEEVGQAVPTGGDYHAYMWTGTSKNGIDLNPNNCRLSVAQGARGGKQVGYGSCNGSSYSHAMLWSGTAASYVDLHRYLPASYNQSFAYGIDANGTIVGVAYDGNFKQHAILWIPDTRNQR